MEKMSTHWKTNCRGCVDKMLKPCREVVEAAWRKCRRIGKQTVEALMKEIKQLSFVTNLELETIMLQLLKF